MLAPVRFAAILGLLTHTLVNGFTTKNSTPDETHATLILEEISSGDGEKGPNDDKDSSTPPPPTSPKPSSRAPSDSPLTTTLSPPSSSSNSDGSTARTTSAPTRTPASPVK
ncbi:glycoprotein UL22A [Aotine betaherpesvirus 1]|uniref:Glycoprotein UL22A n=1 Tax=Aotine betaherpesvirus 1 TaxID=50290 RepID=G8XU96_9BETA|nr:glycoprotein UL22A [Aotine betaherpesvirus 1]AEV80727.1 glycoprotein UL22A [Aotine betaherpesvirus 1]